MIKRKLFEQITAGAITATNLSVPDERTLRQQHETTAGRPHPLKADAALPLGMDGCIGVANRLAERGGWKEITELKVVVWDVVDSELAGQLAGGMGTHSIGDDQ